MIVSRKTSRRTWRCPQRKRTRASVRSLPGFGRGPDDLSQALAAFTRAIRCQRQLARLAPRFFDPVVVDREAREREEQRLLIAKWEPILRQAYGASSVPLHNPNADLPPMPGPTVQRAVERELAGLRQWMDLGRTAFQRHQQRRPHAVVSWYRILRLVRIGFDFGRYACGIPPDNTPAPASPPGPPPGYLDSEAALKRAYGSGSPSNQ